MPLLSGTGRRRPDLSHCRTPIRDRWHKQRHPRAGRATFSLVEIVLVMAILLLLLGLALPAFTRMATGSGADLASTMVASQLRLVRQYAITNRVRIAILMPGTQMTTHGGTLLTAAFPEAVAPMTCKTFRPCLVDASNQFVDWVPGTTWTHLPAGIAILEADQDAGSSEVRSGQPPQDGTFSKVNHVPLPVGAPTGDLNGNGSLETDTSGAGAHGDLAHNVRAIVFKPSGRLNSLQRYVTIGEAEHDGAQWAAIRNRANLVDVCVDQYTGRVVVKGP